MKVCHIVQVNCYLSNIFSMYSDTLKKLFLRGIFVCLFVILMGDFTPTSGMDTHFQTNKHDASQANTIIT